jgi:hypothetical protein
MFLLPALVFNLDWSKGLLDPHNIGGAGMVIGTSVIIDVILRKERFLLAVILLPVAMFFVYTNLGAAMGNLSLASAAATQAESEKIAGGSHLASQRSQLKSRIDAQVQLAGWAAVGALQAEVDKVVAEDPRQWKDSSECEAPNGPKTGAFCTKVATAKAKVEAAKTRDELQAKFDALPAPKGDEAPKNGPQFSANPSVANKQAIARELGYDLSEQLILAEEAFSRALAFELLAAFGPSCWLMLIDLLQHGTGAAAAGVARARSFGRRKKAEPKAEPVEAPKPVAPAGAADDIDRMYADEFDLVPTGVMRSKEIRPFAHAWFDRRGIDRPQENLLWQRLQAMPGVKYDPNNGRPRYIGIRPKQAAPQLRLVAGNEA